MPTPSFLTTAFLAFEMEGGSTPEWRVRDLNGNEPASALCGIDALVDTLCDGAPAPWFELVESSSGGSNPCDVGESAGGLVITAAGDDDTVCAYVTPMSFALLGHTLSVPVDLSGLLADDGEALEPGFSFDIRLNEPATRQFIGATIYEDNGDTYLGCGSYQAGVTPVPDRSIASMFGLVDEAPASITLTFRAGGITCSALRDDGSIIRSLDRTVSDAQTRYDPAILAIGFFGFNGFDGPRTARIGPIGP